MSFCRARAIAIIQSQVLFSYVCTRSILEPFEKNWYAVNQGKL